MQLVVTCDRVLMEHGTLWCVGLMGAAASIFIFL